MQPNLRFEQREFTVGDFGTDSTVPDLLGLSIIQNDLIFELDESDEIYEAYGKKRTAYPYAQQNTYNRKLQKKMLDVAILENDCLEALFLPELGGRLWSLIDKKSGKNLLYTNDVIRFSNLSLCNAWFSGGVEWNLGVIGHTPLTCRPLYTAKTRTAEGFPVLRMYEYERIRNIEYQMDFWLDEGAFLNCRMRVVNSSPDVTPMYWWTNIAVPEYNDGRVVVPAKEAYTSAKSVVSKVAIPKVNKVDVSFYNNIYKQVDYFFHIPQGKPKFIANLDADGFGLLHFSTQRLQSRKLFSWGSNAGSARWQNFLTEKAGRYLEIQAGLGKTQYGCIPMAPHTAWEWIEQFGAVQVEPEQQAGGFDRLVSVVSKKVQDSTFCKTPRQLEQLLVRSKTWATERAELVSVGSGYAVLQNSIRSMAGTRLLSSHLDYLMPKECAADCADSADECDGGYSNRNLTQWQDFLQTGVLHQPSQFAAPDFFVWEKEIAALLKKTIGADNRKNWYAHYQLGLYYLVHDQYKAAKKFLKRSVKLVPSSWALHALAVLYFFTGERKKSRATILRGALLELYNLSYLKDVFMLLNYLKAYGDILALYLQLSANLQADSRLTWYYLCALHSKGRTAEAFDLLNAQNPPFELDDLRECDDTLGALWRDMNKTLTGQEAEAPEWFNFNAL